MKAEREFFEAFARPEIRELKPYDASGLVEPRIRVSANENNYGCAPSVTKAMQEAVARGNRYPESTAKELRQLLASRHGLRPEQLIISNGLDGFFTMLGRAFLSPGDEVICSECTFGVYADTALIAGARPVLVPLDANLSQRPCDFAAAVTEKTKLLVFCNPNNPTGELAPREEILAMLRSVPKHLLVLLDEAYIDFTDEEPCFPLLDEFPNLLICRTFSKLFALAGLRVGWTTAAEELIELLYRVREPYCVTQAAQAGACAALGEENFAAQIKEENRRERARLEEALAACGVKSLPSAANFIMLLPDKSQLTALKKAFLERKIAVRLIKFRGVEAIRLSVGMPNENQEVIEALKEASAIK